MEQALTALRLLLAILLGLPPMLAIHVWVYRLFGHRVHVRLRERLILVECGGPEYRVEVRASNTRWRIIVRTCYELDPFL